MAASVQFRPQNRDLGMVMREVDEEIAIFLGMRNAENQMDGHLLVDNSDEFDNSTGAEPMPNSLTSIDLQIDQIAADDNFLKLESDKSDFDWLLAQADTSLLPTYETSGVQDFEETQTDATNGESISLESEQLACDQTSVVSNVAKSTNVESSASKRPSSSGNRKQTSRAATPTRRSSLPAKPKPSRASTPTSRTSIPSSKPTAAPQARSSTPSKSTSRSSTPSTRASLPTTSSSKPRSSTPTTRKPTTPLDQSSSMARNSGTTVLKIPVVKSRSSKPSESLSISQDATQNPKTVMPKRPASASRGRPISTTTTTTTTTTDTNISSLNGKPRQKSCSPARVRVPNGIVHKSGKLIGLRSRGYNNCGDDDVNPVLMGTQMVERVVNMRKLAPPKLEESLSNENTKRSSKASGFGRSLSSRSLEMAVRHMDIRRSIADGIRPVATGVLSSSSSSFGVRSCSAKSGTLGASDSPVASSSDGSESFNSHFGDENEMDGSLNMKC